MLSCHVDGRPSRSGAQQFFRSDLTIVALASRLAPQVPQLLLATFFLNPHTHAHFHRYTASNPSPLPPATQIKLDITLHLAKVAVVDHGELWHATLIKKTYRPSKVVAVHMYVPGRAGLTTKSTQKTQLVFTSSRPPETLFLQTSEPQTPTT